MAENTEQFKWIVLFVENLKTLFAKDPNVFVAGDLLWYPIEGRVDISWAPDAMVVFGRPQGPRRCYKQWEEGNLAPQVVFEVLSPSNTALQMMDKFKAYESYGVEEYYVYDPEEKEFRAWLRREGKLAPVEQVDGFESPRLRVRFWPTSEGLAMEKPGGGVFETHTEVDARAERERQRAEKERQRADLADQLAAQADQRAAQADQRAEQADQRAEQADQRAEQADQRAEQADQRADQAARLAAQAAQLAEQERQLAEQERQRAEQERQRAEQERQRAEQLAEKLRLLGIDPS